MDREELKWRARDDARVLAEAEVIKADKERLELARVSAEEMLREQANRMKGLSKVASSRGKKTANCFNAKTGNPAVIKKLF